MIEKFEVTELVAGKPNAAILFVRFVGSCLLFAAAPFHFQAIEGSDGVTPRRRNQPMVLERFAPR